MFLFHATLVFFVHFCHSQPLVKTQMGEIQGYFRQTNSRKFAVFEGIPFAKPPIGQRRFEPPEPSESWCGIWNASFPITCAQPLLPNSTITHVQEDCLYLNIYVPWDTDGNLDVIVHIHGGAFMYGSGHWYAQPDYFMDYDVVFVTFNYRVGIFGFLSTEDEIVPGNMGLKDQVMALKWVKSHIRDFKGNPNSVTLTGLSAGASCVHLHFFSKWSQNLFQKAFSESGVALNPFSLQKNAKNKAKMLAEAIGCPNRDSKVMVKCLKERPFEQILDKISLFYVLPYTPLAPFAPVVEKSTNGFLEENPFILLSKGQVLDVPWLVTNVPHEGLSKILLNTDLKTINQHWETLAPILLDYNHVLSKWYWWSTISKIKNFYLKNQNVDETNYYDFVQMFSDRNFLVDAETAVRWQSKMTNSSVFYARFNYLGDNNKNRTVVHGDDARYFFGSQDHELTANELKMKDVMVQMLVKFAKNGKPKIENVVWKPTSFDKLTFLNINGSHNFELRTVENLTPRKFWKDLGFAENENLIGWKIEL